MTCSHNEGQTGLCLRKKLSNYVLSDISFAKENDGGKKCVWDEDLVQNDDTVYSLLFEIEE